MTRFTLIICIVLLSSCSASVPDTFYEAGESPVIYPDYADITVPVNIAPLIFRIDSPGEHYITRIAGAEGSETVTGKCVELSCRRWRRLIEHNDSLTVEIFAQKEGRWERFIPFTVKIESPTDRYVTYRKIPPSAVLYTQITLNQRDLTNFDETVIYSNGAVYEEEGQCINCHHCRNGNPDSMQFHARGLYGGTVMLTGGKLRKLNFKSDSTISSGVYPAWHPTHGFIAYSTNVTRQLFHLQNWNRIEVFDESSDIILYDIGRNEVSPVIRTQDSLECFPEWSPDGRTLYYVAADKWRHYNLYAKPFDPDSLLWGESVRVYDAASENKSVTLPRVSPDGKYLMMTVGPVGVFHIWHREADLYMLNLEDLSVRPVTELNSPDTESYHDWSSDGKWVIFSTRRDDGTFTRLYMSHFGEDGRFSKPFPIPQKYPEYSSSLMLSYNIPEFITEPVRTTPRELARFIRSTPAETVRFRGKK